MTHTSLSRWWVGADACVVFLRSGAFPDLRNRDVLKTHGFSEASSASEDRFSASGVAPQAGVTYPLAATSYHQLLFAHILVADEVGDGLVGGQDDVAEVGMVNRIR